MGSFLQRGTVESRPGRRLQPEDPASYGEGREHASHRQRAHMPAPVRHRPAATPDSRSRSRPNTRRSGRPSNGRPIERSDRSAADDRSGNAGSDADALSHACLRPTLPISIILLAGMPHGERSACSTGRAALRPTPLVISGLSLHRSFTVTAMALASPGLPATWSRSTDSLAYRAKIHYAMGMVAFWTQPISSRDRFHAGDLSPCH